MMCPIFTRARRGYSKAGSRKNSHRRWSVSSTDVPWGYFGLRRSQSSTAWDTLIQTRYLSESSGKTCSICQEVERHQPPFATSMFGRPGAFTWVKHHVQ